MFHDTLERAMAWENLLEQPLNISLGPEIYMAEQEILLAFFDRIATGYLHAPGHALAGMDSVVRHQERAGTNIVDGAKFLPAGSV